jgi:hypothetical protein
MDAIFISPYRPHLNRLYFKLAAMFETITIIVTYALSNNVAEDQILYYMLLFGSVSLPISETLY